MKPFHYDRKAMSGIKAELRSREWGLLAFARNCSQTFGSLMNKNLALYINHMTWSDALQRATDQQLCDIADLARRTVAAGGDFVIEGDPSIPIQDHRFTSKPSLDAFLDQINAGRQALGKTPI